MSTTSEQKVKSTRDARARFLLAVTLILAVAGPPVLHAVAGGWVVLAYMIVVPTLLSAYVARIFRFNVTQLIVTGFAYWLAYKLYFNDAAWIYLPVVVLLSWGAMALVDTDGMRNWGSTGGES